MDPLEGDAENEKPRDKDGVRVKDKAVEFAALERVAENEEPHDHNGVRKEDEALGGVALGCDAKTKSLLTGAE